MRRFIIGDIHGCYDELQALLDKAGLADGDEIIAVGDLFDRGPQPRQVLDFFRGQRAARAILGNHERKHLRMARGEIMPALAQRISRRQFGRDYGDALAFMAALPHYIELPEADIVHGYFEPGVPLHRQDEKIIVGTMSGDKFLQEKYDRPWYELYDGEKPLIVGHRDYSLMHRPLSYHGRVYGLDTGCVYGGRLTGLLLPDFRLVSVPGRRDHWTSIKNHYLASGL